MEINTEKRVHLPLLLLGSLVRLIATIFSVSQTDTLASSFPATNMTIPFDRSVVAACGAIIVVSAVIRVSLFRSQRGPQIPSLRAVVG